MARRRKQLNVALIGHQFMGRAHSNAWSKAGQFFDLPAEIVMKAAAGRNAEALAGFAQQWGWAETTTDWTTLLNRDDIDIIDIATPTKLHAEMAIAAAKAGKHIFCEKPFAMNSREAKKMLAAVEASGVTAYLNHNYRRCPAIALARQMIDAGRIGRIFHWRGAYLQSWTIDPDFPLTWQLQKEHAAAGPQWDLNSHSVDLARYLVGEITAVQAMTTNFIKRRPLPTDGATGKKRSTRTGEVTVDDAAAMLVEFDNGAMGTFEASRFATGRKNYNTFEIYGDKGAITFNLERMNELEFYDNTQPTSEQGFRTILATEPDHPYVGAWWPPGHIIGYEHEFVHAVADFVTAIVKRKRIEPNFHDGLRNLEVLEAGLKSAATGRRVNLR